MSIEEEIRLEPTDQGRWQRLTDYFMPLIVDERPRWIAEFVDICTTGAVTTRLQRSVIARLAWLSRMAGLPIPDWNHTSSSLSPDEGR
ncbi:MAG: hypothetical protein ACRDZW_08210 [Acidimicrobiales bacterium]